MSLITDKKFFEILRNDERITARVGKNIKNTVSVRSETSIPPIPLILVCYQGMTNRYESKDDEFDTSIDDVNIEIVVAHENREKLGELIHLCRVVIGEYISNNPNEDLIPIDTRFPQAEFHTIPSAPAISRVLIMRAKHAFSNNLIKLNQ